MRRRAFLQASLGAAALTLPHSRRSFGASPVLDIRAGGSPHLLHPDASGPSDLWTYNGTLPGPEIRVRKGERVRVRLRNDLAEPTSIHWHGIRIDNAMDGVAGLTQEAVAPGESFLYDFVVPDSGTYWYHAHNRSWNQVGRGLYGPLIVEEEETSFDPRLDLVLMVDDWRLDAESFGSLMDWSHGGRLGNWLSVNGQSQPVFKVRRGEPCRLRVINAANSRVLELDPARFGASVLAYDGQPLPGPETLDYAPLLLGPAQRIDLLFTPQADFLLEELSGPDAFVFASFQVDAGTDAPKEMPRLRPNSIPEPALGRARTVSLLMEGGAMGGPLDIIYKGDRLDGDAIRRTGQLWAMNGVANLADEPLFRVDRGETVVLETSNETAWIHAIHLHGHHFRIIERSGSSVEGADPWRDTFLIGAGQRTRIAFVADNPGKWLLHCHMLEHAAAGMNTWFEVV